MNLKADLPLIERAEGRFMHTADGRAILDGASGGVGAVNIGHAVPEVLAAIAAQSQRVCHANASLFRNEPALDLARLIIEGFAPPGMEKVYYVSTGTEATELCVKFARMFHLYEGRPERFKIISRWSGYHGSSLAALSFSGRSSRRHDFHPYYFPSCRIPPAYPYRHGHGMTERAYAEQAADELETAIRFEGPDTVSCFIAEPLVNTMGACPAPAGYFERIREICDRYNVLLIMDEVVTGFGRTGRNFGIDHWGVTPDLIACGKGLSGGYAPLACGILHERIVRALSSHPSGHTVVGYTHAANPLSTATSLAVLSYIKEHDLVARSAAMGETLSTLLHDRIGSHPHVGDIRGKGLHMAIEFVKDRTTQATFAADQDVAGRIYAACMRQDLNLCPVHGDSDGVQGDSVIIKPAFTITEDEMHELVRRLGKAIESVDFKAIG